MVYWVQLWSGQDRRVRPLADLSPRFPPDQWPMVEVVRRLTRRNLGRKDAHKLARANCNPASSPCPQRTGV